MRAAGPGAVAYVFPAVALAAVVLYFVYGIVDRGGLTSRRADVIVTGKEIARGSTTYPTTTAGGRAWTRGTENPDWHILTFQVEGESAGGAVSPELYDSVQVGDRVRVRFHRTRIGGQLLVTDVSR